MVETGKARERREREGFFERYMRGRGVDIGCGDDPVTPDCTRWELEQDAYKLTGAYDWVYSSHCLEHLDFPVLALRRWWACLKTGGHLIIALPHRDLYERRTQKPSNWNGDHRHFWLPVHGEPPCTFGLLDTVELALPDAQLVKLTVEDVGWTYVPPSQHAGGEYSIEGVWRK